MKAIQKELTRNELHDQISKVDSVLVSLMGRDESKYPDFRFICPNCGSLEVTVTWKMHELPLSGHCLDCNEKWIEGMKQNQTRDIDRIWSLA